MTQDCDNQGERPGAGAGPAGRRIDDETRRRLGRNLRLFYADVLEQPLPERLTQLVDDLVAGSGRADPNDREGS